MVSLGFVVKVGVLGALACASFIQPYRPMIVVGRSMEPTYGRDSILLTEPVQPGQIKRGAVVVIDMDTGPIVKRIAFVGGDKILQVQLDGEWTDLLFVHAKKASTLAKLHCRFFVVPKGTVYVLGDNQDVSYDSKEFGCVSTSRIHRILANQRPFNPFSFYHPLAPFS